MLSNYYLWMVMTKNEDDDRGGGDDNVSVRVLL